MSKETLSHISQYPTIVAERDPNAFDYGNADSGVPFGQRALTPGAFISGYGGLTKEQLKEAVANAREALLNNQVTRYVLSIDGDLQGANRNNSRDFTANYWQLPSRRLSKIVPSDDSGRSAQKTEDEMFGRDSTDLSYDDAPNLPDVSTDLNGKKIWSPYMPHLIPPTPEDLAAGRDFNGNVDPADIDINEVAVYSIATSGFSPPIPTSPASTSGFRTARSNPINYEPEPVPGVDTSEQDEV